MYTSKADQNQVNQYFILSGNNVFTASNPFFIQMNRAIMRFWRKPIFTDYRFLLIVWVSLALFVGVIRQLLHGLHGNYQIYKLVFFHLIDKVSLYPPPTAVMDSNHYGPLFGLIIAPFAVLPDLVGGTLWVLANVLLLFYAVYQLPLKRWQHAVIYWFCLNSLFVAVVNVQFNIAIAAIIVLSFTFLKKEKEGWAALLIMVGAFVKLYGIVGLSFFFFSKHKLRFVAWCAFWAVILFVLPMAFTSPDYIIAQYGEWFHSLVGKNNDNAFAVMQDISVFGMVRRVAGHPEWSNLPLLLVGLLAFGSTYLRFDKFRQEGFQLLMLASVLLFTVLFSTGSEQNTYLIAMVGVAVWFVIQPHPIKKWQWGMLAFVFIFTSMAPSDLFPRFLYKNYMQPYSLMAFPCLLVWIVIVYEMLFKQSKDYISRQ